MSDALARATNTPLGMLSVVGLALLCAVQDRTSRFAVPSAFVGGILLGILIGTIAVQAQ